MDENTEQQAAPEPQHKKPQRRGLRYIGDGIAHYSGVPARDLSWAEARSYIGESYEIRRHAVERPDAIYAWGEPEGDEE